MEKSDSPIIIKPRSVAFVLLAIILCLLIMCVVTQYTRFEMGRSNTGIVRSFDVNKEFNIPSTFSAVILLLSSCLLGLISRHKKTHKESFVFHWTLLAFIFLYLSVDEAGKIHELTMGPVRRLFDAEGFLFFAWVIPAFFFLIAFAVAYWKFLFHLPRKYQILFCTAGAVYIAGALGLEMVGARYVWLHGKRSFLYSMITVVEEGLEMTGVLIFIYALLDYMKGNLKNILIHFGDSGSG